MPSLAMISRIFALTTFRFMHFAGDVAQALQ
jgi:hypothetical protein